MGDYTPLKLVNTDQTSLKVPYLKIFEVLVVALLISTLGTLVVRDALATKPTPVPVVEWPMSNDSTWACKMIGSDMAGDSTFAVVCRPMGIKAR